jgi:hypothetical protein
MYDAMAAYCNQHLDVDKYVVTIARDATLPSFKAYKVASIADVY